MLAEPGAAQVRAIVEEVRPDTILTFGPDGMTGHQGHMDVCRWATEAFETAGKPGARLYYATQTPAFVAEVVPAASPTNDHGFEIIAGDRDWSGAAVAVVAAS